MASAAGKTGSEHVRAVAEACKKKEWSKAIRIITSLPETANSALLIWYFCPIRRVIALGFGVLNLRDMILITSAIVMGTFFHEIPGTSNENYL